MDIYLFNNSTIQYITKLPIMLFGTSKNRWSICDIKWKMICINVPCEHRKHDLMLQLKWYSWKQAKLQENWEICLPNLKSATVGFGSSKIKTL
jgi:hypothetical protein